MASLLFYLESILSYAYMKFTLGWDLKCEFLDAPMYVSTPVGGFVCVDWV